MNMIQKLIRYFYKIKNFAHGEINERIFSNPNPRRTCVIKLVVQGLVGYSGV